MKIAILGQLPTHRCLVRELAKRGHDVVLLERDEASHAAQRDPDGTTILYGSFEELRDAHEDAVRDADLAIVGSEIAEGARVGDWVLDIAEGVTAFHDIDTPVTLTRIAHGEHESLHPRQIPLYDLYLSSIGGPVLKKLERQLDAPCARALYCSFDPEQYFPEPQEQRWDLGFMGSPAGGCPPGVKTFLLEPARQEPQGRFVVAGARQPDTEHWPANVTQVPELAPADHRAFYGSQRFTLSLTRHDAAAAGWSPNVRLFEAAACGTPILSDRRPGIESLFVPHQEILLVDRTADVLDILRRCGEQERLRIAERARQRVLAGHTAAHRAAELEHYTLSLLVGSEAQRPRWVQVPTGLADRATA